MKRIFFSTYSQEVGEINEKIEELTLIRFILKDMAYEKKILIKKIGVVTSNLKKIDIENLLKEMRLQIYDYQFIRLVAKNYTSISKEGFEKFFSNCESELMTDIQTKKIKDINITYDKIMKIGRNSVSSCNVETEKIEDDDINKNWKTLDILNDEEIKKIYGITREEIKSKIEKQKVKAKEEERKKKIKKIILKSLYYLQTDYSFLDEQENLNKSKELDELIKIYKEYIREIEDFSILNNKDFLVRLVIHSICILEKIYITNLGLKNKTELELDVFKFLSNKKELCNITYDLLERELIKCLLFKLKSETYVFNAISPSFYLTTPLRMSCLSYVRAVTMIDRLIENQIKQDEELDEELEGILKIPLGQKKGYNRFLSGSKLLNDSSINDFSEIYLKKSKNDNEDTNQCISTLYSIYFKYKERERIKNNYSDKGILFYERANIENFIFKEKILRNIVLYNFIFNKINVTLSKVENFENNPCLDYVIHLNRKSVIENTRNISLDLMNENADINSIKRRYISTSRALLDIRSLENNNDYYLVKFLELKEINNQKFYIFESNIVLTDFFRKKIYNGVTYGNQIITFILSEKDFEVIGKVFQINYDFLCTY